MPSIVIDLGSKHQSGRTTIASAIARGMPPGLPAAYFVSNLMMRHWMIQNHGLFPGDVFVWDLSCLSTHSGMRRSVVILDGINDFDFKHEGQPVEIVKAMQKNNGHPCQIITIY